MIPLDPSVCPDCAGPLRVVAQSQPALIRSGGYGATETLTEVECACGYWRVRSVATERPDRIARSGGMSPE